MRSLPFLLFLLLPFNVLAAPTSSDGSSTPQSTPQSTSSSASAPRSSALPSSSHPATRIPTSADNKPVQHGSTVSEKPSDQITARPGSTPSTSSSAPRPTRSHVHDPPQHPTPASHQSIAKLVFEIIGVLAALLVVLGVGRCLVHWYRTPRRDRIAALLRRHQLQREMEELERNPPDRRRSLEPPPPPYLRPPAYDDDEGVESAPLAHSHHRSLSFAFPVSPEPPPEPPNG